MLEKEIEKYFGDSLKSLGCLVYKFISPGNAGVPDRIVIAPGGWVYFIELKRPGGRVRTIQHIQMNRLKEHGVYVDVISNKQEVDEFCKRVKGEIMGW